MTAGNGASSDIITIEQFAERLQISRSTAYTWIAEGRLVSGTHLLRIGRVIRVLWSEDLLAHLLSLSASDTEPTDRPVLKRNGRGGKNRCALDWDYINRRNR